MRVTSNVFVNENHGNLHGCTMVAARFTRYAVDKACLRSCVQNACGHKRQMDIWKQPSRPVPRCRLDASESLPKSAVSSARFLPRREINFMRTRKKNTTNDQRTQDTFKLVLPSRRRWHPCHSIATNQDAEYPTSCSSRSACNDWEPQQQKIRGKRHPKNLQSICMRFKMYASSRQFFDAHADPSVILFNARLENNLREDS